MKLCEKCKTCIRYTTRKESRDDVFPHTYKGRSEICGQYVPVKKIETKDGDTYGTT